MKKIQTNCIQTLLEQSGMFMKYRITYPVSVGFVLENPFSTEFKEEYKPEFVQINKNRWICTYESTNWKTIQQVVTLFGIYSDEYKLRNLRQKREARVRYLSYLKHS